MIYYEHKPHQLLGPFIDAYWSATGEKNNFATERILPDGCVDLIYNLGDKCKTDNGSFSMYNEKVYFVGTMSKFKETSMCHGTHLLGVRFKPAAFSAFYHFEDLKYINDQTIEFEEKDFLNMVRASKPTTEVLDEFFLRKLTKPKHILFPIINQINHKKGIVNIKELAQRFCTTPRQLERGFKQHIGLSPKEYSSLIRYQNAHKAIKKGFKKPLADIAYEFGYYDHSHLASEIKKYSGLTPKQL